MVIYTLTNTPSIQNGPVPRQKSPLGVNGLNLQGLKVMEGTKLLYENVLKLHYFFLKCYGLLSQHIV